MILSLFILLFLRDVEEIPTLKAVQAKDEDFLASIDDGPLEVLPGCSWYCGGFVSGFNASSTLSAQKNIRYAAELAHDFNITTAWVDGNPDYGVGEYLEYSFDMTTIKEHHELGITKIIIANGYKKSKKIWQENSRVKKLKLYVDNKPFAHLELLDSYEFQTVAIGKLMLPQQHVMTLRFEIVEVYPGTKYQDTAITELLFDGVGVH